MKWDIENFEVKKDTEGNLYLVSHSGMIIMKFRDRSLLDSKKYFVRTDRKSTRLNSSHSGESRMPSSA